jgi:hypothetical protein
VFDSIFFVVFLTSMSPVQIAISSVMMFLNNQLVAN